MKKIAIFNHKGGVAKTTTTYQLGWQLAKSGRRVILVDTDSQCNLTLLGMQAEKFEAFYEREDKNNLKDALSPAFEGKPALVQATNCQTFAGNENLFLLPGHLDFSEIEVPLGLSLDISNTFNGARNLPGAINYLVEQTAEKYQADYVLFDMNPSLSAINQVVFLSSDFFIIPTSPDIFSAMAIRSLARMLPQWERWAKQARSFFEDSEYPLPLTTPIFLGYTINDFKITGKGENRPAGAFEKMMDRVSNNVTELLVPGLEKQGMVLPQETYTQAHEKYRLNNQRDTDSYCLSEIDASSEANTAGQGKSLYDMFSKKILFLTRHESVPSAV